jgi:hypothetical protein
LFVAGNQLSIGIREILPEPLSLAKCSYYPLFAIGAPFQILNAFHAVAQA